MKIKLARFRWKSRIEHRRLALLMGVALIALIAGASVLVRIVHLPTPATRPAPATADTLNITRIDSGHRNQVLREEALLLDPTPLFLPTPYNSSSTEISSMRHREPGETFAAFPPKRAFSDEAFAIPFPDPVKIPARPVDALVYGQTQTPFALIGRFERPETPLAPRMAFLEVVHMKTGRTLLSLPLPLPAKPETAATPDADTTMMTPPEALTTTAWRPIEFLAAIDDAGLVGDPTPTGAGSGSPAIDQYLENYLMRTLHLGAQRELSAGFYTLRIGP